MISYEDAARAVAAAVQRAWNSTMNSSDLYIEVTIESASGASDPAPSAVEGVMT
jgi:hypothetical protein